MTELKTIERKQFSHATKTNANKIVKNVRDLCLFKRKERFKLDPQALKESCLINMLTAYLLRKEEDDAIHALLIFVVDLLTDFCDRSIFFICPHHHRCHFTG